MFDFYGNKNVFLIRYENSLKTKLLSINIFIIIIKLIQGFSIREPRMFSVEN